MSFVYFIKSENSDWVKIGFAIGNPEALEVLASVPGPYQLERQFHRALGGHPRRGEWFHWDEITQHMVRQAKACVSPGLIIAETRLLMKIVRREREMRELRGSIRRYDQHIAEGVGGDGYRELAQDLAHAKRCRLRRLEIVVPIQRAKLSERALRIESTARAVRA